MKKIFLIFISSFILLNICGCKSGNTVKAVFTDISFTAEMNYNNQTIEYLVKTDSEGNTETEILKDGMPSGFKILNNGNDTIFTLDGIEKKVPVSSLPDGIITDLFYICFKDASEKQAKRDENCFIIEGKTDKYNYKITLGATGLPLKLYESHHNISVNFKNQRILKADG